MSKNDIIILDSILQQKKIPGLTNEESFEIFAFEQVLKDYDLSYDELIEGKIGEKNGLGFFNFVNEELIDEETDLENIKKPIMTTFLILAKSSYTEVNFEHITNIIKQIFDFSIDKSEFKIFRNAYLKLNPHELTIHVVYVNKEDVVSNTILFKINSIKKLIAEYIPGVNIISRLVHAGELILLSRKEKSYTLQLRFHKLLSDEDAYFVLSTLTDYGKFVTDNYGKLRKYIFDFNIRDFQRTSEVNKGIEKTLNSIAKADFWWVNNGIAILATNSSIVGNILILDDVQVVNGLQTTHVIYKYLKTVDGKDNRKIGIKIVTTTDNEVKDRIIEGANSQNPILKASLRANDTIQRNIESYLLNHGWFYDRRKNYYKNIGKPSDRIISIGYLAQAIMSMVYREPNRARRNPSTLTKDDKDYELMFGLENYKIFLFCINNMKKIDSFVRNCDYGEQYKTNLRWHLAVLIMVKLCNKKEYTIADIEPILDIDLDTNLIKDTMSELVQLADSYLETHDVIFRTMSTTKEFVNYILGKFNIKTYNLSEIIESDSEI